MIKPSFGVVSILLLASLLATRLLASPLVIAHRGASGYLPEHTIAAKAMAYAMGSDYLEVDTVLTRDGVAIVFHDLYLDAMTDVESRFKNRARADGKHYVVDFSLAEIRGLSVHERIDLEDNSSRFPGRFPPQANLFRIHTLAEELALIQGLNHSTGNRVGVYVELKSPRWHAGHDLDIAAIVLDVMHSYGYRTAADRAFIQCFDAATLRRIKREAATGLPLIQLIGENRWWPDSGTDFDFLKTRAGLEEIATYASGIGPWYRQILLGVSGDGIPRYSSLAGDARDAGLVVHAYTLRADALPDIAPDFEQLLRFLVDDQKVDGIFTDHPDRVRDFIAKP